MNVPTHKVSRILFAVGAVSALCCQRADACAVCFGDPDSSMAKGVVAGVFVLFGVISFVLVGLTGTGLYWLRRSRQVALATETVLDAGAK